MASNTIQFDATVDAAALNRLLGELKTGTAGAAKAINDLLGGTVTKKIVLQEVSDGAGGKRLVAVEKERLSVADQIISKQKQLNATQQGSVTSLRQQLNSLKQARDATVRYEQSASAIGGKLGQQRAEWVAINAQVSQVSRNLAVASASGFWDQIKVATRSQGLINISNGLVGITQGFQAASILAGQFLGAINSVVDASAKLQSFALAFKAIGAGSAGAVTGLQESSRIALGLGVDLNTVVEGFRQLSPVVLNSGGTLSDVSDIVESLSSRFAAFGISGDRARRVMNGVIQAFSKGKLQAEELTQQISEADPAFKTDLAAALLKSKDSLGALGKEIDGTIPNLEKLVKAQKLTSEVLIKVLPELSKSSLLYGKLGSSAGSAVDALERSAVTIDQVRANLGNLNELSLRDLALSSTPLINALLRVQAVITDTFSRIAKSDGFEALSSVGAELVQIIAKLADGFFVLVEGAVGAFGALKPIIDLAIAIAQIPGVAQLAGVALLGKLLGPLKLLEGRVASIKAAFQGFKNGIKDVFSGSRAEIASITNELKKVDKVLGSSKLDEGVISKGELTTLRAGSAETATFTQRQQGLAASKRLLAGATENLNQKLIAQEGVLNRLQNAQVQASLAPVTDKTRAAVQAKITQEIERTTNAISLLKAEQEQLRASSAGVDRAIQTNAQSAQTFGGFVGRTTAALGRLSSGIANFAGGAINAFKSGVSSLLGLLDPLLLVLIAVGVSQRLYADGTREASEATARYAEQINVLRAAITDLNPSQEAAKGESTALGRAWEKLALAAVKVGDATKGAFEFVAKGVEGITAGVKSSTAASDGFVNIAASIALVSGSIAAFAAAGSLVGPAGTAVGAVVGALVGVYSALALGTSDAAAEQEKLKKTLAAVSEGAATTAKEAAKLAAELKKIKPDEKTGAFNGGDLQKQIAGTTALRGSYEALKKELAGLQAVYDNNQDKIDENARSIDGLRIANEQYKAMIAQEQEQNPNSIDAESNKKIRDYGVLIGENKAKINKLKDANENLGLSQGRLIKSTGELGEDKKKLNDILAEQASRTKAAEQANVKYANTTGEIEQAIKTLKEENATLELGDDKAIEKFDRNIVQIKELQGLLEDLGKTPVELQIEASGRAVDILNSDDIFNFDPGPLREARKLVRETSNETNNAFAKFAESAEPWAKKIREGTDKTGMAGEQLREAGQEFAKSIAKGAGALADQLRSLEKLKFDSTKSLSSLILSKPEFFTPAEVKGAVADAAQLAQTEANKAGITFTPKAGTDIERAQENLSFAEARNQANDLRQTILDIGKAVQLIAAELLRDTPRANELLKQYGLDAKDLVRDVGEGIDGIAAKGPRVGQVFGEFTANGQTTVLYFDNLTGQTEQLSKAAFDAAVKADKLAGSVSQAGKDAKGAEGKLGGLKTQIGQVLGTITADGKTQVQFFNKATGQVELLEKAAFDRLSKEQGVTAEIDKQNAVRAISLKLAQGLSSTGGPAKATGFKVPEGTNFAGGSAAQVFLPPQTQEQSNSEIRELARRNGSDYIKTLAEVMQSGKGGFMPQALLGSIQTDATAYRQALEMVAISQAQATQAQAAYNQALAAGSPDIISYAANLANAKLALEQTTTALQGVTPGYAQAAATAKELGIALDSVPSLGEALGSGEVETAEQSWREYVDSVLKGSQEIEESAQVWDEYAGQAEQSIDDINALSLEDPLEGAATGATNIEQSLADATTPANNISNSLGTAAQNAADIKSSIDKLQDLTVTIRVNGVPGFFTGGPVTAGQEVRVNELGKEGFLSRGGNLSPINVPANATWRPPTSGTIIPAHIWDKIDAPTGRVKASPSGPALRAGMSAAQARQTQELGILGRAVNNLTGQMRALTAKEWTVNTKIRNSAGNTQIRMINGLL